MDDVPLSQRVRPSGPNVVSLARPPQARPPTPSGHASASGTAPWSPRFIRTDGSSVKPTETMFKDGKTAMAYYRSMWTPKDIEVAKSLSQREVFSRFPLSAMEKQVEHVNAKVRALSDSLNAANKENDDLAAQKTGLMVQLGKIEKERDSLRKETDSLQDERNALQLERSVWHTERESLKAEKEELLRLLSDEQSARMAFEKKALDKRNTLLDTISRVNGGMLALHARFSRVGALRYAQGFREGYADRVPDEGQTGSTHDDVDKDLDIDPPGVYTDPDSTAAEGIFDKCQEIASSRITHTPPAALTLDILPLSTLTPSAVTAEDNPQ
ncbi:uncharacterized protein LOC132299850 isoform X2 [Cornus florida]|uniref:uncharacterized protein LOC132292983 isoform X2 n=1 Tax=Cornus florida TaxID=4283 RepID=UPI00289EAD22|nr:uncharacterized protein LOC132292983 isoform X2 [Cornus florida]XP_059652697.1 uncharacterized protein LOC132299850 isoform X2 [Cornus florida]